MRNLFVLRHGKAAKDVATGLDYDRILNKKGQAQVNQVGYILQQEEVKLDYIIASKARRTFETSQIVNYYLGCEKIEYFEDLYLCDKSKISEKISACGKQNNLLYVGHNNGISDFVNWLCDDNMLMNTGMLVKIRLDIEDWSYLSRGLGEIEDIIKPEVLTF